MAKTRLLRESCRSAQRPWKKHITADAPPARKPAAAGDEGDWKEF
jgi:hypothetical protein